MNTRENFLSPALTVSKWSGKGMHTPAQIQDIKTPSNIERDRKAQEDSDVQSEFSGVIDTRDPKTEKY